MTSRRGVPLPKGVNRVKRYSRGLHVGYHYYYRPTGAKIEADPSDPAAFHRAYLAAKSQAAPPDDHTFPGLVTAYLASPEFDRLVPTSKGYYRSALDELRGRFDWVRVADLAKIEMRDEFYEWRDEMRDRPRLADARVNVLKRLLSWGVDRGKLTVNLAASVKRLVPAGHNRRERIWSIDQEVRFLAHAEADVAQFFRAALYSTQRRADVAAFSRANLRDGWLTVRQRKTGAKVELPVFALDPFRALVDELPSDRIVLLTTRLGRPWTGSNISLRIRETMKRAGMADADLTLHDLRGTGLTRMADAGCTEAERAAISGHSLGTKLGDYTAMTRQLALSAYQKWNELQRETAKVVRNYRK